MVVFYKEKRNTKNDIIIKRYYELCKRILYKIIKKIKKVIFVDFPKEIPKVPKNTEIVSFYNPRIKQYMIYLRDKKTKRFIKRIKTMFRLSFAINYVVHSQYYSLIYECFIITEELVNKFLRENKERIKEGLISMLEDKLGYSRNEFWFDVVIGFEKEEIPIDLDLIGEYDIREERIK